MRNGSPCLLAPSLSQPSGQVLHKQQHGPRGRSLRDRRAQPCAAALTQDRPLPPWSLGRLGTASPRERREPLVTAATTSGLLKPSFLMPELPGEKSDHSTGEAKWKYPTTTWTGPSGILPSPSTLPSHQEFEQNHFRPCSPEQLPAR